MDTETFIAARKEMGLSRPELAVRLGLKGDHSVTTIERIEAGSPISGPMGLAMEKLLGDHRKGGL